MAGTFNRNFKNKFVEEFIADVANTDSSSYYIGFGKAEYWVDDQNPPAAQTSIKDSYYDVQKNLLFGKKINASDLAYMIPRTTWTSNTVYSYYSHLDPNLYDKEFFVINTDRRVYKCLFNNYGAPSTVEPTGVSVLGDFDTADGYKWKYMYTVTSANMNKYATTDRIPVFENATVALNAEEGAIHVCVVDNGGTGYISAAGTVEQIVSNTVFKISNTESSPISGIYNLSAFYLGGVNPDETAIIEDYVCNTSGRYVITQGSLTMKNPTYDYIICPYVKITGDGQQAFALSTVNTVSGAITSIQVVNRGFDYTYADVQITANSFFGSGATAHAIISPRNGHGTDIISELGSDTIGISVSTNPTDNLYSWATYRQTSLLYNPIATANGELYTGSTFTQVNELSVSNFSSIIFPGETITGLVSGATAKVLYMSTTTIYVIDTLGEFQLYETVLSDLTGASCVVSSINKEDIIPYSSEVFYYNNIEPIDRTGISSEQIKLYFKF